MTVRDITVPNHRRLSNATLASMKKSELIEYIRYYSLTEDGLKWLGRKTNMIIKERD